MHRCAPKLHTLECRQQIPMLHPSGMERRLGEGTGKWYRTVHDRAAWYTGDSSCDLKTTRLMRAATVTRVWVSRVYPEKWETLMITFTIFLRSCTTPITCSSLDFEPLCQCHKHCNKYSLFGLFQLFFVKHRTDFIEQLKIYTRNNSFFSVCFIFDVLPII